jgi:hypothetical protein
MTEQKFEVNEDGQLVNKDGEDVDFEEDLTFDE